MKILNELEKTILYQALFYANISELKNICKKLVIQPHGEKIDLIKNIYQFVTTGKPTQAAAIPHSSKAQPKKVYSLHPDTFILHGAFKNDLKIRIFLKSLIGNHFHYTAFGIDWIEAHWLAGTPPTYQQFAIYWQEEYQRRLVEKAPMKTEWAYLNFLDRYKQEYPQASKALAIAAWKKHRQEQVEIVQNILNS